MSAQVVNEDKKRLWLRIILVFAVFILVFKVVEIVALSAVGRVLVELESDQSTVARLYFSRSRDKAVFNDRDVTQGVKVSAGQAAELKFDLNNSVVRRLRLDPGTVPGVYKVYKIIPLGFFGRIDPLIPYAEDLVVTAGPGTTVVKKNTYLEITAQNNDPYVIFNKEIKSHYYFLPVFSGAIIAFIVFVVTGTFRLTECVFWRDTFSKKPSSGVNYETLDGFRGLAALFVLASHTGLPGGDHLGMTGVVMFFSLSGFLLTMPYAREPQRINSLTYIRNYFFRRFKRIVPMFYFIIAVSYLFHGRIADFIRSALFLQGNSILWTVLQEIHFYVFLPVVLLINFWVCRGNRWAIVTFLLVMSYCFNHSILTSYPIYGLGGQIRVYAGIFLAGIMFCFVYHIDAIRNYQPLRRILGNPVVALIILFFLTATSHVVAWLHGGHYANPTWQLLGNFCYFVSFVLLALLLSGNSLLTRFFSLVPLRLMGTISYSFYLLHPTCLQIVKKICTDYFYITPGGVTKFILTFVLTFMVSALTYTYIERPCK